MRSHRKKSTCKAKPIMHQVRGYLKAAPRTCNNACCDAGSGILRCSCWVGLQMSATHVITAVSVVTRCGARTQTHALTALTCLIDNGAPMPPKRFPFGFCGQLMQIYNTAPQEKSRASIVVTTAQSHIRSFQMVVPAVRRIVSTLLSRLTSPTTCSDSTVSVMLKWMSHQIQIFSGADFSCRDLPKYCSEATASN